MFGAGHHSRKKLADATIYGVLHDLAIPTIPLDEVAKANGVSRTTVIRIEQAGGAYQRLRAQQAWKDMKKARREFAAEHGRLGRGTRKSPLIPTPNTERGSWSDADQVAYGRLENIVTESQKEAEQMVEHFEPTPVPEGLVDQMIADAAASGEPLTQSQSHAFADYLRGHTVEEIISDRQARDQAAVEEVEQMIQPELFTEQEAVEKERSVQPYNDEHLDSWDNYPNAPMYDPQAVQALAYLAAQHGMVLVSKTQVDADTKLYSTLVALHEMLGDVLAQARGAYTEKH